MGQGCSVQSDGELSDSGGKTEPVGRLGGSSITSWHNACHSHRSLPRELSYYILDPPATVFQGGCRTVSS